VQSDTKKRLYRSSRPLGEPPLYNERRTRIEIWAVLGVGEWFTTFALRGTPGERLINYPPLGKERVPQLLQRGLTGRVI